MAVCPMCNRTPGGTVLAMITPNVKCTSKLPTAHEANGPQPAGAPAALAASGR
jgi:hypothetical protein